MTTTRDGIITKRANENLEECFVGHALASVGRNMQDGVESLRSSGVNFLLRSLERNTEERIHTVRLSDRLAQILGDGNSSTFLPNFIVSNLTAVEKEVADLVKECRAVGFFDSAKDGFALENGTQGGDETGLEVEDEFAGALVAGVVFGVNDAVEEANELSALGDRDDAFGAFIF